MMRTQLCLFTQLFGGMTCKKKLGLDAQQRRIRIRPMWINWENDNDIRETQRSRIDAMEPASLETPAERVLKKSDQTPQSKTPVPVSQVTELYPY